MLELLAERQKQFLLELLEQVPLEPLGEDFTGVGSTGAVSCDPSLINKIEEQSEQDLLLKQRVCQSALELYLSFAK